ncbi:MAG: type II toxin-antitoxin system VapC family toxin [SAR324 cluster bacterium]|nr:type II toxin-antitoxin system VapC family toxin [SAR324 cluster bacterium]
MRLLLDTSIVVWVLADHPSLKKESKKTISDAEMCYVSSISLAEIEIKKSIGKLEITDDYVANILESGFEPLHYGFEDARILGKLPFHHKDPFDRMLITQVISNKLTLLTSDRILKRYDLQVIVN